MIKFCMFLLQNGEHVKFLHLSPHWPHMYVGGDLIQELPVISTWVHSGAGKNPFSPEQQEWIEKLIASRAPAPSSATSGGSALGSSTPSTSGELPGRMPIMHVLCGACVLNHGTRTCIHDSSSLYTTTCRIVKVDFQFPKHVSP